MRVTQLAKAYHEMKLALAIKLIGLSWLVGSIAGQNLQRRLAAVSRRCRGDYRSDIRAANQVLGIGGEEMKRVEVTNPMVGICHMQVCTMADVTDEEILDVCNHENPSGTTGGWSQVIRSGEGEPVTCREDNNRKHFLVAC
jgi:hypothetical protein